MGIEVSWGPRYCLQDLGPANLGPVDLVSAQDQLVIGCSYTTSSTTWTRLEQPGNSQLTGSCTKLFPSPLWAIPVHLADLGTLYRAEHGDCSVSTREAEDPRIVVHTQRRLKRKLACGPAWRVR